MKKVICMFVLGIIAMSAYAQQNVDLGLPSGTLWCSKNEPGYYSFTNAISTFGERLPTDKQFNELIKECKWTWHERGYYVITGRNGKSITLPANGYSSFNKEKSVPYKGYNGYYWSRKRDIWDYSVTFFTSASDCWVAGGANRKHGYSIRFIN